ncbi:MAG: hypothetical protein EOP11_25270 [Proteobacteria bacterium]|nr:MAG: hypothetical protein EOP11_25270 [Pseudomonadota bacterium]
MRNFFFAALAFAGITLAPAAGFAAPTVDALVAKVGREAVLLSDLQRFRDLSEILDCASVVRREGPLAADKKGLLDAYIEEDLMFQEARSRKLSTAGMIPQAVKAIHKVDACKERWQKLGAEYSKVYRTEARAREGESLLVRELEKRVLVERFRKSEAAADGEGWKREAKSRYPVKVYLE